MSLNRIVSFVRETVQSLSDGPGFRTWVRQVCKELEWRPLEASESSVSFGFNTGSGFPGRLLLVNEWPKIKFVVVTPVDFDSDKMPSSLSLVLLVHNSRTATGAWQVVKAKGELLLWLSHTIDSRFSTGPGHVATVAAELVEDYEQFVSYAAENGLI